MCEVLVIISMNLIMFIVHKMDMQGLNVNELKKRRYGTQRTHDSEILKHRFKTSRRIIHWGIEFF